MWEASPEPTGILPRYGDGAGTGVRFLAGRSPYSRTPAFIVLRGLGDVFFIPPECIRQ